MAAERYNKIKEQMQLLQIKDVSTKRQHKNGTITWRLPIKNQWNNGSFIEVASFKSGYVRNNNSCYTNYQLNKRCESEPDYYKIERNGETLYRKYTTRTCKLIPIEIDRLEYLISYCLKNYYIKHANFIPNGDYIPKNQHKWELARVKRELEDTEYERKLVNDCGHYDRIQDLETRITNLSLQNEVLQNKLEQEKDGRCEEVADFQRESDAKIRDLEVRLEESDLKVRELQIDFDNNDCGVYCRKRDLENKLDTIKRIADHG